MIRLCESCATDDPSARRCQPEAAHQPQTDSAGCFVTLDARDQQDIAFGIEGPLSAGPAHAPNAATGDDLVRDDLDHRRTFVREAQAESRLGERRQVYGIRVIK